MHPPAAPQFEIVREEPAPAIAATTSAARWRALLWSEWFAHARLVLCALAGWLLVVWTVPLFAHPLWVLVPGLLFSIVAGPAFGGADVIHGVEEFSFAFPVTRSERFLSRAAFAGMLSLGFAAAGAFVLENRLADVVLRAFIDTGFGSTEINASAALYGLMVAFPFAAFALGFSAAALATARTLAFTAWLWGVLGALAVLRAGVQLEEHLQQRLTGRMAAPLLAAAGVLSLLGAWRLYVRKEAGAGVAPLRIPRSWWGWLLALAAAAIGTALLGYWLAANLHRML